MVSYELEFPSAPMKNIVWYGFSNVSSIQGNILTALINKIKWALVCKEINDKQILSNLHETLLTQPSQ